MLVQSLEKVLANSYVLYIKTQNYHWNVTGGHFQSLHTLFEAQYTDLFAANDEIAERIRTLGTKVEGTMARFLKDSDIAEGDRDMKANDMVKDLAASHKQLIKSLYAALEHAEGDEASIGLLTERITVHEKHVWMLNSSVE